LPASIAGLLESGNLGLSTGRPGPHDFTVRLDSRPSDGINASIATRPAILTTRSPLWWGGTASENIIFRKNESKIFRRSGHPAKIVLESQAKLAFCHYAGERSNACHLRG
jgi:hypothetical protein